MNPLRIKQQMEKLPRPPISFPGMDDLDKYLEYRNLMDKYWIKKDMIFISLYGDKFWPYKFGKILDKCTFPLPQN